MEIEIIKNKIKPGDMETAAKMIGISTVNAYKVVQREGSKHYDNLYRALSVIIAKREEMIEVGI